MLARRYATKTQRHRRAGSHLARAAISAGDSARLQQHVGLDTLESAPHAPGAPSGGGSGQLSFRRTFALQSLHIWMLLRRLKQMRDDSPPPHTHSRATQPSVDGAEDLGLDGELVSQEMYDSFMEHTELTASKVIDFSVPSRWISELEKMFYGAALKYDEAMRDGEGVPSDASMSVAGRDALADALLKNVVEGQGSAGADEATIAALLARYVRRELLCLEMTDAHKILEGNLRFSLDDEYALFRKHSQYPKQDPRVRV